MEKQSQTAARIKLAASMTIFGTIGVFRRWIPLGSASLAMSRGFLGMAFLLLLMAIRKKRPDFSAIRKRAGLLLLSGAFIGVNWMLLFEAYNYTTVAVATLCYYMSPALVVLASVFLFRERLGARKLLCVLAALVGMTLVSGILRADGGAGELRGVLLGLGAALFYAYVVLLNQKLKDVPTLEKTIVQLFAAGSAILPYALLREGTDFSVLSLAGALLTLAVGAVHTGLAYALYFGSMGSVSAQSVALFGYIDPVVAVLLSAFLLNEPLLPVEWAGAALVLLATVIGELPLRERQNHKRQGEKS